jgi:hypothetical protein
MKRTTLFFLLLLTGCYSATRAKMLSSGQDHHITQYSGGVIVGEWISNGRVFSEEHSDGYYFEDKATGKVVEVSGNIQIRIE